MKKFALLAVVVALVAVADVAQAGVFRRGGGGCPGGVCGVAMAPAPKVASTDAPPAPAKVAEAPKAAESTPAVAETTTQSEPRLGRTRLIGRRR